MKIKFFFIQFLALFTVSISFAQVASQYLKSHSVAIDHSLSSRIYNDSTSNIDLSTVEGSPYENNNFQIGKAINRLVGEPQPFYVRYNVYNDVIELKEKMNESKIIGLIKSSNIYVVINNIEYHYEIYLDNNGRTSEGYFILLTKGKNNYLYLKRTKEFKDKVQAKDSFHKDVPATFVDSKSYYIKKEKKLFPISNKKKKLLQQFPKKESELKKYIKSEKINLRSEKDFIKLFKYLDSILNSK